jgi:Holliday junction resolvase RusA-like endonuclease
MPIYDIEPMAKPRMTQRDKWKCRPIVLYYNAYKDMVRLAKVTIPPVPRVVFWIPFPKTYSQKKRRELDRMPHIVKPDKDNLEKALLDAVFGKYAETDDSHVWLGWTEKRWTSGAGKIEITDLSNTEIFKQLESMSMQSQLVESK